MFKPTLALLLLAQAASSAAITKEVVAGGLRDPMEICIAEDGDVYVIEREGRVLRVRPSTGGVFVIGQIPVTALRAANRDSDWAREDGGLGIALDPDFANNGRVFIYYSHEREILNRLSRFEIKDGALDLESEVVLLDVPTERNDRVCHHGGAIQFGPDGLLYLSTGDNTNPFESAGSAPIDDRPGRAHADAMRTAANTNDLRGKILRIRPTEEGYEIPEGNLFAPGTELARPEIYIMGCRNPFRFSIDERKGTVYWGEVGPDAREASARGPLGYDEVNQAKGPGNFGWPFVIGDNEPYAIFDFETNEVVKMTDPEAPVNPGHRNTGLRELPPAQPAMIWYPYVESEEFPELGSGGRNAMAGPVFYHEPERPWNLLGEEDDGTLLVYEWMRGKIWKAGLDEDENLTGLEVLIERLVHPMDLEMGPDGTVWLLEYGTDWYFNRDGRISRLRPETGNSAPVLAIEAGSDGRSFRASEVSDPDGDEVALTWWASTGLDEVKLGEGLEIELPAGEFLDVRAVADDGRGGRSVARHALVEEETAPSLRLVLEGNPRRLSFGQELSYQVRAEGDAEVSGEVVVRARYIPPTGHDAGGPQFSSEIQELVTVRACLACHQVDSTSVGPSYLDVAMKYRDREDARAFLISQIENGSGGVWGEVPMPPQVVLEPGEAEEIVRSILALADGMSEARGTVTGRLTLAPAPDDAEPGGAWEITAESPGFTAARFRVAAR